MRCGDVIADRFEVERLVGSGGMGAVYRAYDRERGEAVALKLLHGEGVDDGLRFARECLVLSELRHPGIVQHVSHGVTRHGESYLAMEWIEGEDLAQRLSRSSLRIDEIVTLGRHVAEALSTAHARGVVHRDIKPSNLLLPGGRIDQVKVADFGLARIAGASRAVTRTGRVIGTVAYLAPEQARGDREQGPRVDVFALGCVLFECLTGRAPFEGKQAAALLAKIVLEDAPRAIELRSGIPEALDRLVGRMLCRDPAGRPADGAEVAAAFAALDVAAFAPPAPSVRLPSLSRREQRLVALILADASADAAVEDRLRRGFGGEAPIVEQARGAVEPFEARLELLDEGRIGVALAGSGSAVDQIAHAASCALAMRAVLKGAAIVLCVGPGVLRGRLPMGPLLDRATALLQSVLPAAPIALDEVSAGLLHPRFEVSAGRLLGEREGIMPSLRPLFDGVSPLVGRDRELLLLEATLDDCIHGSVATAVLVTGLPGVGKSRLRAEVLDRFQQRGDAIEIWTAQGTPLGAGRPLGGVAELLRTGGRVGAAPEAFPELAAEVSAARPLVIVLEDLQWIDARSIQLMDAALRAARDRPLLVCGFGRPEVHDGSPRLWADRNVHEVRLGELTRRAAERLVLSALGEATTPGEVLRITTLAEGNPLCLVELCRASLAGQGDALPETVAAMALAELASLPPEDRRLLRAAIVVGGVFTAKELGVLLWEPVEAIVERLSTLVEREVLLRRGEGYDFQRALVREGASRMLTEGDRALGKRLLSGFRMEGAHPQR